MMRCVWSDEADDSGALAWAAFLVGLALPGRGVGGLVRAESPRFIVYGSATSATCASTGQAEAFAILRAYHGLRPARRRGGIRGLLATASQLRRFDRLRA